jgi:predicted nucleotidyltransferase
MDFRRPLRVVTPTLDGDVLTVLSRSEGALTSGDVHRILGHGSDEGVRKALARLTREGIVRRERAGRAFLYSMNREHLAAPWIEGLAAVPGELVEKLRQMIESWQVPTTFAVLFGSVGRGEAREESDLDLLLIRPEGYAADDARWREQVLELEHSASAWTGNDARVLEYGESELTNLAGREPVLEDAARDGIELAGSLQAFRRAVTSGR